MTDCRDVLRTHGWRTEGSADVALPSCVGGPHPALGAHQGFLAQPGTTSRRPITRPSRTGRPLSTQHVLRLTRRETAAFDAGLAAVRRANFMWWQDDHNVVIDLRVALPIRWVALEVARQVGADQDDTVFLFWHELVDLSPAPGGMPTSAPHRRPPGVLRPLARSPTRDAEGSRHRPGPGRRPDPRRGFSG